MREVLGGIWWLIKLPFKLLMTLILIWIMGGLIIKWTAPPSRVDQACVREIVKQSPYCNGAGKNFNACLSIAVNSKCKKKEK